MQTLVQVFCYSEATTSLRKKIDNDPQLGDYYLERTESKRKGRANGWAKIKSTRGPGVLNLEWDADANMLYVRVINKNTGTPDAVMADFIEYLFAHHRNVIKTVNIIPIS